MKVIMATKFQWQLSSNGNLVPMATKVLMATKVSMATKVPIVTQWQQKFHWQLSSKAELLQEGIFFLLQLFARDILSMKELEIEETKTT